MHLARIRIAPCSLGVIFLAAVVLMAGCQGSRIGEDERVGGRIEAYVKALAAGDIDRLEELEWGEDPASIALAQDAAFGRAGSFEVVSVEVGGPVEGPDSESQLGQIGPQGGIDPQRYRVRVKNGAGEGMRLTVAVVQSGDDIWVGSPLLE